MASKAAIHRRIDGVPRVLRMEIRSRMSDAVTAALAGGCSPPPSTGPTKKTRRYAMIDALLAMLERADLDAAVRVVALRGAGNDFCAGMT